MDFSSSKFMLPFAFDRLGKVWGIDYAAMMPSSDYYRGQIKFSVCLGLMIVLYSPFKWIFFMISMFFLLLFSWDWIRDYIFMKKNIYIHP